MKKETFEQQKAFAGHKVASMKRRMVGHNYHERQMYMITMATEGRRPLFGHVVGKSEGELGSPDEPRMVLSELGRHVAQNWHDIAVRYPQIEVLALQMMPDHFHGILFVREHLDKPLGKVLLGFKQGCNKSYREIFSFVSPVSYVAVLQQQTEHPPVQSKDDRNHGLLFERSYNDKLLLHKGQLDRWYNYLRDNPRRLLMKREHPDLFHVQRGLNVGNLTFSAIGNRFLLQRPFLMQVQCSRSLTQSEILAKVNECLKAAEQGAVLVSPSISPGEKAVMRAAFNKGFPLILLQENGMTDMTKPSGKLMGACADGRLLLLAPWDHHNERMMIRRDQCLSLNDMARIICSTL